MTSTDGTGEDWLDLADAIALLRNQVTEAQDRLAAGHDRGVLFGLGEITLELGMELTRTNGVDGGLRFSVAKFGGKRETADKSTHKVTVRLDPRRLDGRPVDVSDEE
ncbi:trypco2 family protein [Streptomyces anthocyanicus]|uniref:trypco2 family protein n=1 Tax=Streptomyces TaxID=1883 RepID=UPI0036C257C4